MNKKTCIKCNLEKDISEFYHNKGYKDGHIPKCRDCIKKYRNLDKNKERERIQKQKYYQLNKEKKDAYSRKWAKEHPEQEKLRWEKSRKKHRDKINERARQKCKTPEFKEYQKQWRDKNPEKVKIFRKTAYEKHKYRQFERKRERYKTEPQINVKVKLSARIRYLLSNLDKKNGKKTIEFLGCNLEELINHFKTLFYPRNLQNNNKMMDLSDLCSSEVEIDHIIACHHFDLSKKEEQKKCFHYTNLQPLWKEDHRIKTDNDLKEFYKWKNSGLSLEEYNKVYPFHNQKFKDIIPDISNFPQAIFQSQ